MSHNGSDQGLVQCFGELASARKAGPTWLADPKQRALEAFARLGLPTAKDEDWKYTSLSGLEKVSWQLPSFSSGKATQFSREIAQHRLPDIATCVFVDGHFVPELSDVQDAGDGIRIGSFHSELPVNDDLFGQHFGAYVNHQDRAMCALNTALFCDGAVIAASAGQAMAKPVQVLFFASGEAETAIFPRLLVVAAKGSQMRLVETYVAAKESTYLTNAVTEIAVGEGAVVDHVKVQSESMNAFHIATVQAYQERSSSFSSCSFSLGGGLVRNDINSVLDGEGVGCTLNGLYIADGAQHVDNHTMIDHAKPHGTSQELYKGVLAGSARGVFNGKVHVRQHAQKTDARQSNKNLLLSDNAVVNTKPQLEIFADDVRCTHGATIGQLDDEALFYLRTRGIGEGEARRLLVYGFARDLADQIGPISLKASVQRLIERRLPSA